MCPAWAGNRDTGKQGKMKERIGDYGLYTAQGYDEESMMDAIREIDDITRLERFCSDDLTFYIFYNKVDKITKGGCRAAIYDFIRTDKKRLLAKKSEEKKGMPLVHMEAKNGSAAGRFLEAVSATGIMLSVNSGGQETFYGFTDAGIRSLFDKLTMHGASTACNTEYRNLHLAYTLVSPACRSRRAKKTDGIPEAEKYSFTVRNIVHCGKVVDRLNMITGVTSGRFGTDHYSVILDLYNAIKGRGAYGTPIVRSWLLSEEKMTVDIILPERARKYRITDSENVTLTPGLRITDSDNGRSGLCVKPLVFSGTSEVVLDDGGHIKRHNGQADVRKEGLRWIASDDFINAFAAYFSTLDRKRFCLVNRDDPGTNDQDRIVAQLRKGGGYHYARMGKKKWKLFEAASVDRLGKIAQCTEFHVELCLFFAEDIVDDAQRRAAGNSVPGRKQKVGLSAAGHAAGIQRPGKENG